jgi:hypothetical protein
MDARTYKQYRQDIEKRRDDAREAAERKYLEEIKTLENFYKLEKELSGTPGSADSAQTTPSSESVSPILLTREAIEELVGAFTLRKVFNTINARHPEAGITRAQISSALHKLKSAKEIKQLAKGRGRKAGSYQKSDDTSHPTKGADSTAAAIHANGENLYDGLKRFVEGTAGEFPSTQLRAAANGVQKDIYAAAVRKLVQNGVISVVLQPIGKRVGIYKKLIGGEA